MATWLHRDVTVQSTRLRVTEGGSGPVILFIHGLLQDSRTWDGVMTHLGPERRVVAVDLPGFGESEKPPLGRFEYTVDAFTEVVCDLYGGLDLGRAAVVGHGLGGAIALRLAAKHPELVSSLTLLAPHCYPASPDIYRTLGRLPFVGGLLFKQLLGRASFRTLYQDLLLGPHAKADTARADAYYDAFNSPAARGSTLATLRRTVDTRPTVADLARIVAPTLIVWGRADRVYPCELGQRLARQLHGAGLRLLDAGHCPQEEQPEALASMLREFTAPKPY
ncbi:MAG: alpha/beta hydrolase [Polyangiaceae bacterium]|nr:alpha/beta hydrolase [Polyangiaceae bacterium]